MKRIIINLSCFPILKVLCLLFFGLFHFSTHAAVYSISDYLQDVKNGHEAVSGADYLAKGGQLRESESNMLYSPQAIALAQINEDKRITSAPLFQGTSTTTKVYSVGVGQQTPFGLAGKLSYNLYHVITLGANPAFLPINDYYFGGPGVELTQSLWRNFFGREIRAKSDAVFSKAKISNYVQTFKKKMLLLEAEGAYWRLVLARENIKVAEDSFAVAKKIRDWAQHRSKMQLGDRGDYLQAQSAVLLRELEVKACQDELKAAARNFNLARGREADEVSEILSPLSEPDLPPNFFKTHDINREDLEAARTEYELAKTGHILSLEENRPTFEVFLNYSLNGRNTGKKEAIDQSFESKYPNSTYGFRFQAPLDYFSLKQARAGHEAEEQGALLNYHRKKLEVEKEWEEYIHKYKDSKERLTLLNSMEKIQKEKLFFEREKHNRGRTTTFQVLMFEQDYTQTVQNKIRAQAEVLGILAKMKTFSMAGGNHESR